MPCEMSTKLHGRKSKELTLTCVCMYGGHPKEEARTMTIIIAEGYFIWNLCF